MFKNFGFFVIQVFVFHYKWKSKNRIYKSRRKYIRYPRYPNIRIFDLTPPFWQFQKTGNWNRKWRGAHWSATHSSELSVAIKIQHYFHFEVVTISLYRKIKNLTPQYWIDSAVLMLSPHSIPKCTDAIPPQYWIASTVLMLFLHSTYAIPTCTDAIPLQYYSYSSAVLNSLHSTDAIPHMYCSYPFTVLNSLRSTDDIPLQCWCYPPAVLMLFPAVLMLSPTCTDTIPPQYWTASAVLNSLRSTGPTLYGVIRA